MTPSTTPEDPDQRRDADDQRHGDEEAGDEPAPQPVNHDRVRPSLTANSQPASRPPARAVPREHAPGVWSDEISQEKRAPSGSPTTPDTTMPTTNTCVVIGVHRARPSSSVPFVRGGREHRRHAQQEREARGGLARRGPKAKPIVIVAPDRDTPGISASACATPTRDASPQRRGLGLSAVRRPSALGHEHQHADHRQRDDDDRRRPERVLDESASRPARSAPAGIVPAR